MELHVAPLPWEAVQFPSAQQRASVSEGVSAVSQAFVGSCHCFIGGILYVQAFGQGLGLGCEVATDLLNL